MLLGTMSDYATLEQAYDYFNQELFSGQLPGCQITLHRYRSAYGYFGAGFWTSRGTEADASLTVDEIALNPDHLDREDRLVLSTLVHEMVHQWQQHHGKPSRSGYHNSQWAKAMEDVGLTPFNVDDEGKKTGQRCSHRIVDGGDFDKVCGEFLSDGTKLNWRSQVALLAETKGPGKGASKSKNKVKYTCPGGCGLMVWGKPGLNVVCGACGDTLEGPEDAEGDEDEVD